MSTPEERAAFTTWWRSVCDLIDADPLVPLPEARAHWVIDGQPSAPRVMEVLATGLGAGWEVQVRPRISREWLELSASKAGTAVAITAHAAQVCTREEDSNGPGWRLLPAIAALLEPAAEREAEDAG